MHCNEPACASVCPVSAFTKTPEGPVVYDAERCIGCRFCMVACPFGVPKYEWSKVLPLVVKCTGCYSRVKEGMIPACAKPVRRPSPTAAATRCSRRPEKRLAARPEAM